MVFKKEEFIIIIKGNINFLFLLNVVWYFLSLIFLIFIIMLLFYNVIVLIVVFRFV